MIRCYNCMEEFNDSYDMCPYCGHEVGAPAKEMYFLQPGTMIQDRYEIGVAAGSGGFGITYKAWDHTLQKIVAVKEYYPAGLVNRIPGEKKMIIYSGNREKECLNGKIRFLEEARNMAKFNTHANIVNVYDFFEENNTAYIIMEFLDGVTYKEYIKENGGKVDPEKAVEVTKAILNALNEVHNSGILHRDISPDNIFLCKDGKIKLIDFGAARFSSTEEERTRSIILKPGFAPPEQYQSKSKQGPWTDVYAVGATLYQAVTGVKPPESVNRVEEECLIAPDKLADNIAPNLNNSILRALALLPEIRFQTTTEFMEALNSQKNVRDVQNELKMRKRRRVMSLSMVAGVVILALGVLFGIMQNRKRNAGFLDEATITMWVCAEDQYQVDEMTQRYRDALAEYMQEYPQIDITIQGYAKDEYAAKVEQAAKNGTLPTICDTTDVQLAGDVEKEFADLKSVLKFINTNDYYFLNDYAKYFPNQKKMPLAFRAPVAYFNTVLAEGKGDNIAALLASNDAKVTVRNYLTYNNMQSNSGIVDSYSKLSAVSAADGNIYENAAEDFLAGNLVCLISDTGAYGEIEKNMAGYFGVKPLTSDGLVGSFTNCFSINNSASRQEKDAAVQVLVYLLAETGQDVMNIQNVNELPLYKKMYETFISINPQLNELGSSFERLVFFGEEQVLLDKWYEGLVK